MHHGTDTLDSVSSLDFPVIWGGWAALGQTQPRARPTRRSLRMEVLVWLAGGLGFASTVALAVSLLAVLD